MLRKQSNSETLVRILEKVFEHQCISKPYYHGGKYNGKSMVKFMTNSGRIMDDIKETLLLRIDQGSRYCDDEIMLLPKNTRIFYRCLMAFFPSAILLLAVLQKMTSILSQK